MTLLQGTLIKRRKRPTCTQNKSEKSIKGKPITRIGMTKKESTHKEEDWSEKIFPTLNQE